MSGNNLTKVIGALALAIVAVIVISFVADFGSDTDDDVRQTAGAGDQQAAPPAAQPTPPAEAPAAQPTPPAEAPAVAEAPAPHLRPRRLRLRLPQQLKHLAEAAAPEVAAAPAAGAAEAVGEAAQAVGEAAQAVGEAAAGDVVALLAAADADAGLNLARRRCYVCHTFDAGGANRVGPNLYGVIGRAKGAAEGYVYSEALTAASGEWTYEDLDAFLTKPTDFLGDDTKMKSFPGMESPEDRAAIIAYLRAQSDSPPPLPN